MEDYYLAVGVLERLRQGMENVYSDEDVRNALAWTIEYTQAATTNLASSNKQMARRIVDYMNRRVARMEDPRHLGKALTGPLGELWRYRVGNCGLICDIQDRALRVLLVRVGSRGKVYRRRVIWARLFATTESRLSPSHSFFLS